MSRVFLIILLNLCITIACFAQDGKGAAHITDIYSVTPSTVAIVIETGAMIPGQHQSYTPQEGDKIEQSTELSQSFAKRVVRNQRVVGVLTGPKQNTLYTPESFREEALDTHAAVQVGSYRIRSSEDDRYAEPKSPIEVFRKSKPTDVAYNFAEWKFGFPMRHTLILKLAQGLKPGKSYQIDLGFNALGSIPYTYHPKHVRSEAVQVSQIGFRPDDPRKYGVLSYWRGNGGPVEYPADKLKFYIIAEDSDKTVFEGPVKLVKKADELDDEFNKWGLDRRVNLAKTNVYLLDFSTFKTPGKYRLYVSRVGCSFPFRIGDSVWKDAWAISSRGYYHQRSGIENGAPYSAFERPLGFHPSMGKTAEFTDYPGFPITYDANQKFGQDDAFIQFAKHATGKLAPAAWGGYFDAGDWDRRIQHLRCTLYLLELYELYPDYFSGIKLNIPESGNTMPDILDEAQWGLAIWKRLQQANGGIPGWIESEAHPRPGEVSWTDSLKLYVSRPDASSSYYYAATAARFSRLTQSLNSDLSAAYARSAQAAFSFAERIWFRVQSKQTLIHEVRDRRNLAALELYRLTGNQTYHEAFLASTVLRSANSKLFEWKSEQEGGPIEQQDAAFAYAIMKEQPVQDAIKTEALLSIKRDADWSAAFGHKTAHGWTKTHDTAVNAWGTLGPPQAMAICRAYILSGQKQYLTATIKACQLGLGLNGDNLSMTTGIGSRWPQNVLHIDSRITSQPVPEGITIYGLWNPAKWEEWGTKVIHEKRATYPSYREWPTGESYLDVGILNFAQTEYTVMQTMAPTNYIYGVLAARPALSEN